MVGRLMELLWWKYTDYLKEWADDHKSAEFAGMTPASFEEWLMTEGEE